MKASQQEKESSSSNSSPFSMFCNQSVWFSEVVSYHLNQVDIWNSNSSRYWWLLEHLWHWDFHLVTYGFGSRSMHKQTHAEYFCLDFFFLAEWWYIFNSRAWEAEAGGFQWIPSQPGLTSEILTPKNKKQFFSCSHLIVILFGLEALRHFLGFYRGSLYLNSGYQACISLFFTHWASLS